ncbi:ErfK/YbiS/YcfS/YnhG family protein (plasmid) [Gemmatirosa kalamazoonensis]|uniref:ErfK/YbiS/YcfS/YnhG family protein n=1 Tax=Gemmatirosa kalamazoonensis TaxID=861299 RepID=W0RSM4_9BACT|nr:L,D-transpeptidase family protein [Gemmatirosa kalamazoonensis]AHG92588.1 ErfK/YbiS/YcfS/YnhG family protein [Gemmatirosa kalamazoonensis]
MRTFAIALLALLLAAPARARAQPTVAAATDGPRWIDAGGRATAGAYALVALLRRADERGLRPADYGAQSLGARLAALPGATTTEAAALDVALTRAALRFLTHLHMGRLDPHALGFHLPDSHGELDLAPPLLALSRARSDTDAARVLASVEPPYAGYRALLAMLGRYRALAADPALHAPLLPRGGLRRGDAFADAPTLRRLLAALGDLPNGAPAADSARYDDALAGAVRAFQRRHGLAYDGDVGPATAAALAVPLARRVRQIELTLERWRWLPDSAAQRFVVVNIPAFRLYAFEDDPTAAHPALRMDVIVGRAAGARRTPVFAATMREVVFRPYWDVPPSIAANELLPRIRRRPGTLDAEDLEIVRAGDDGRAARTYAPNAANLARVASGTLRLRQRPGDRNALGPVKLVFPNPYNVYLHGTPARELFRQTRRDFSHGCIRVADPAALAAFALRGQVEWDSAAIAHAMASGPWSRRVAVARPIEVLTLYGTVVQGDDGLVRFYPDVYGHDAALERTLGLVPVAARVSRPSGVPAPRIGGPPDVMPRAPGAP